MSEGELKGELEAFRRDPNISSEISVLFNFFLILFLFIISCTWFSSMFLLPSASYIDICDSGSCEYKNLGSKLIFLSHVISSLELIVEFKLIINQD